MLSKSQMKRLQALRSRLFVCIEFENKMSGGYHKDYEGWLEIGYSLPGIFHEKEKTPWHIHLSCYLLCEGRGEDFLGATIEECLDNFEKFIEGCEKGQAEVRERGIV